ncbi:hypothetical protein ALC56_07054 [Trachymyrmex septentrionalis]|uniref:Odorant receptor 13a n=1 Tax=Trachymyrmex septentrionalis TaxID=34720 RepID=A0A195FDV9_9HYME|nr:hypothetical protein ALC56_07054 [Trachymyrmex septentrionalis]
MAIKITPKTAIAFIKVIVALSFAWPLSKNASKFQVIRFKILRTLLCINAVVLGVPTAYTLYRNDYNLARITKLWCLLGAFIQIPLEITQCALQYDRLQSSNVAQAIYESSWYNHDKIFQKNLNFILLRSQTPTTVSVSILPALSLQFYASVRKVTLKEVISVVKLSLFLVWGWPEPHNATKLKMFCVKLHHYLGIIIVIGLQVPLIYGITNNLDNPTVLTKQVLMLSSVIQAMLNFIIHIINYRHIQNVTFEMIQFCDLMKLHEEIVIQRYIDKCIIFHGISIFIFYWLTFTTIAVIPALEHQSFPTVAEYPFDVSYQPLKAIIFIQQSIAGIIVAGQLCINIYMALLLWFASARFEMLTKQLEKITNIYQLFKCIKKHQKLLKYAREVAIAARPFAFSTICCSTVCLILIFLLIIKRESTAAIIQFAGIGIIGVLEVFTYTWPAEHLMHMNKNVAEATFNMLENDHLIKIWKCLQIIIMRSQKPITISILCLLPILSLNYFTSLVTFEMENFCQLIKPHEEATIQQYISKCVYFYGGSMLWIYLSAVFVITGPVTLDQPFPTNAEYPFVVYQQPLKSIIFMHQSFVCLQASAQLCINIFMALLLWTTSARFELLVKELRTVTNVHGLVQCIRQHQRLLQYAQEVIAIVRPFALTTISLSTFALIIIIGLIFITGQPISIKIQCVGLTFSGLSEVFMYTWPAEHLIHIIIQQAAFDMQWYKQPVTLRKYLQIIMLKAQNPIVITIPCVMPALSLNYYASVRKEFEYIVLTMHINQFRQIILRNPIRKTSYLFLVIISYIGCTARSTRRDALC